MLNLDRETTWRRAQEVPVDRSVYRALLRPRRRLIVARDVVREPPQKIVTDSRPPTTKCGTVCRISRGRKNVVSFPRE